MARTKIKVVEEDGKTTILWNKKTITFIDCGEIGQNIVRYKFNDFVNSGETQDTGVINGILIFGKLTNIILSGWRNSLCGNDRVLMTIRELKRFNGHLQILWEKTK